MTFISKETFQEGNSWLDGGDEAGAFVDFAYVQATSGDLFVREDGRDLAVPATTAGLMWCFFLPTDTVPDTLVDIADGDAQAVTVGDARSTGANYFQGKFSNGQMFALTDVGPDSAPLGRGSLGIGANTNTFYVDAAGTEVVYTATITVSLAP